jgi:hypothetical protein
MFFDYEPSEHKREMECLLPLDNYISCFSPESPMIKLLNMAGLLARLLLNTFPSGNSGF